MRRPVVITGVGSVLAGCCGLDGLAQALACGEAPAVALESSSCMRRAGGSRRAVLAQGPDLSPWLSPLAARRMSRFSRLAFVAAAMALTDAGLPASAHPEETVATVFATSFGPSDYTQRILEQIFDEGPQAVSPMLFAESVANSAAAQVALRTKATGANIAVTQREAGPVLALAAGVGEVESGRADRALVGAADELSPLLHAMLDAYRALALPGVDGQEVARPFDLDRNGFLAGEGAVVLVVEPEAEARRRGAPVRARFGGAVAAFDPSAPPWGWGRGAEGLAARLRHGLERHGLGPESIDLIVSGASGSRAGDRFEADVLRGAWGDRPLPPILAPKGITGEVGGAHLAVPFLALRGEPFGPTAGFSTPDPELGVVPHRGGPLPRPRRILLSAPASGGAAAWAWLETPTGDGEEHS